MNLQPKSDYILCTPYEAEIKTKSGILLTDAAKKEKSASLANVIAVGSDIKDVKVGETVIIKSYSATDIKYEGKDYLLVDILDVIGKVNGSSKS